MYVESEIKRKAIKHVSTKPQGSQQKKTIVGTSAPAAVAVLLCTYNGAGFLEQQLASISAQLFEDWVIYVSDDGSTDATLAILKAFTLRWGAERMVIRRGPGKGFSANFLSLLKAVPDHHRCYAFCDQDDIWHAEKLGRAVGWLMDNDAVPALFCGRTRLIDEAGTPLGFSPLFQRPPTFQNALMQNIAGGNTMVINHVAYLLMKKTPDDAPLVCHDWWAYLLVTGCGGVVHYDPVPTLAYRQHASNVIGANTTVASRFVRLRGMFKGRLTRWNDENIASLRMLSSDLTSESACSLELFSTLRQARGFKRLQLLKASGFYRQTFLGNCGLLLAVILNRI